MMKVETSISSSIHPSSFILPEMLKLHTAEPLKNLLHLPARSAYDLLTSLLFASASGRGAVLSGAAPALFNGERRDQLKKPVGVLNPQRLSGPNCRPVRHSAGLQ